MDELGFTAAQAYYVDPRFVAKISITLPHHYSHVRILHRMIAACHQHQPFPRFTATHASTHTPRAKAASAVADSAFPSPAWQFMGKQKHDRYIPSRTPRFLRGWFLHSVILRYGREHREATPEPGF
jgi:hypothetical protein